MSLLRFRSGTPTIPSGNFTVSGNGTGTAYAYTPVILATTLHRTVLVPQDSDFIDLQSEVAHPGSPIATSWSISGTDANLFYTPASGQIAFKSSSRGTIVGPVTLSLTVSATNAHGTTASVALSIVVPLNSDCRFVSFGSGNDANNGTTPALAWQHVPRQFDFTGTQVTLGAHQVLFFKAEIHRTMLTQANTTLASPLQHTGVSGDPFIYCGRGWGGQASLDGSDVVSGWASVTSLEVFGNPNFASIKKIVLATTATGSIASQTLIFTTNPGILGSQAITGAGVTALTGITSVQHQWDGTTAACHVDNVQTVGSETLTVAPNYYNQLFDDGTMCFPAQWPTPANLFEFDNPFTNQTGGMWLITASSTSDPGGATAMWQTSPTSDVTIRDPRIAARYGNISVGNMPQVVQLWAPGNNINYFPISTYNFATSTITVTAISGAIDVLNNQSAYSLVNHPLDIVQAGQFVDFAGFRYAWLPNNGVTSVSNRINGATLGNYVTYEGFGVQRYSGNASASGVAFSQSSGSLSTQPKITGCKIYQNRANDGDSGMGLQCASAGIADGIIERCYVDQNPIARFISMAGTFSTSLTTPTPAQVRAYPYGKLQYNYITGTGAGRTLFSSVSTVVVGLHILMNIAKDVKTVHGNGVSLYENSSIVQNTTYALIELNLFDNCTRPVTTSLNYLGPRNNTYTSNVFTAYGGEANGDNLSAAGPAFNLFGSDPGSFLLRNIAMMGPTSTYTGDGSFIVQGYGVTMKNNVTGGIATIPVLAPATGGSLIYDLENNLLMVNDAPPNTPPNQIQTSNTVSAIAPTRIWDFVISNEMATALGSGPVGPFWSVP